MLTLEILKHYKIQNPTKYFQKYGSKTPEEVMTGKQPVAEVPDKVQITQKKDLEIEFAEDPIGGAVAKTTVEAQVGAPKRGRKKVE